MSNPENITAEHAEIDDATTAKIKDIIERVELLLDSYCQEKSIEDMTTATQAVFYGGLMFVCFNLFDVDKSLLHKYTQGVSNNHRITDMYDDDILFGLCRYFIYMCSAYNKTPNPQGFSYLTGIELDTLARWGKLESQRPQAYGVAKMLKSAYETGLESGAQSGRNPVGFIATLNHRFGWSQESRPSLTVNITRSQNEIMSTYNQNLIDDQQAKPSETP